VPQLSELSGIWQKWMRQRSPFLNTGLTTQRKHESKDSKQWIITDPALFFRGFQPFKMPKNYFSA
jgi:hypothetical protein